jgi:serine/threonine protein kinase
MAVKYLRIPHSRNDDQNDEIHFKMIQREIKNFQILSESPHIVDFYGLCIHEGVALICMELMDLSLKGFYVLVHKEEDRLFPEKIVGCVFVKIIDALMFCKTKEIMHRDVKPSNILINYRYFQILRIIKNRGYI